MPTASPYNERELIGQIAAGDENAFLSIFSHYYQPVREFVIRFVKSPDLAEDLSQEIFIKAWENRVKLTELQSFRAWLFVIARNHTLNTLKNASRMDRAIGEITRHFQSLRSTDHDEVLSREYLQFLHRAIEVLPPRSRQVFRMCREQGKSYEEVAMALGISRNAVKSHMVYSMKALGASIEKDLGISLTLFLAIVFQP